MANKKLPFDECVYPKIDDFLNILNEDIEEYKTHFSAHEATLTWTRLKQLTNKMHEIKKAAQTRDWGDEWWIIENLQNQN